MIKIYEPNERLFTNNGLGTIEPIKCQETKMASLNGWYVDIEVPLKYRDLIIQDYICFVDTKEKGPQPFRINNPETKNRKVIFKADHVIFDAERYMLEDVRPEQLSPVAFLNWCNSRTDSKSPFTIGGNATGTGTHYFVRKTLLEAFVQAEEIFGTLYDVDGFNIKIKEPDSVGTDKGYRIVYGKNMQEIKVDEDWDDVCTKILPLGTNGLLLPEIYLVSDTQYAEPYTKLVEFDVDETDESGNAIPEETRQQDLREQAEDYLKDHAYPKMAYEVKSDVPQNLNINDVVHIKHPLFSIKANVQSYVYDCISKKVKSLSFGDYVADARAAYKNTVDNIKENAEKEKTRFQKIIEEQTALINRKNKTGYLYITENEMFILDKLPLDQAKEVWRFGLGGIGYSETGYEGPFIYAFTQDGRFNTDFISAGSILTNMLEAAAITAEKIAANAITAEKLAANAITSRNYAYGSSGMMIDLAKGVLNTAHLWWDETGKLNASEVSISGTIKSNSAEITGGSFNVNTESATQNNALRLNYGNKYSFVSPSLVYSSDGNSWAGITNDKLGTGAADSNGLLMYSAFMDANGNFQCYGTKSRIASTENYGDRALYCDESPTPMFSDVGEGQIDDSGKCYIFLDDVFSETIDTACQYQVFLQPYGDGIVYVYERTPSYFIVSGTAGLKFGWEIKSIQKGYDTMRLDEYINGTELQEDVATSTYNYLTSLLYDVEREEA